VIIGFGVSLSNIPWGLSSALSWEFRSKRWNEIGDVEHCSLASWCYLISRWTSTTYSIPLWQAWQQTCLPVVDDLVVSLYILWGIYTYLSGATLLLDFDTIVYKREWQSGCVFHWNGYITAISSGWWFGTFGLFFHLGKNNPIWLLHVSEGVGQPPSSLSKDCWFHQPTHLGMMKLMSETLEVSQIQLWCANPTIIVVLKQQKPRILMLFI